MLRLVAPYFTPGHADALPAMQSTNMPADAAQLAFDAWSVEQERHITHHMLPYWLHMPSGYTAGLSTLAGNDFARWQAQVADWPGSMEHR